MINFSVIILHQYFQTIVIFSFFRDNDLFVHLCESLIPKVLMFFYQGHVHILSLFVSISHATGNEILFTIFF